jgi:hypothetical protein
VATFVENSAVEQSTFNFYKDHIFPRQVRADEIRSHSLPYTALNLEAFTIICRIAGVQGTDLWHVQGPKNESMAMAIDYMAPYLADPRKWPKDQLSEFPNDGLYFLAFGGIGLKKPEYIALFRKLERPDSAWMSLIDLLVSRWEASAHQTRH